MTHTCLKCGTKRHYAQRFDAYYCILCNLWLESTCNDPDCEQCQKRPATPREYFLPKPETKAEAGGDIMSLKEFNASVKSGGITPDDGCVGSIFIDDIQHPEILLQGWDTPRLESPFLKKYSQAELQKAYAKHKIEVEWCNK
jgi:hypothetical protein